MNDDSLMRELGRVAAEEERAEDARFAIWERLCAGELSPEEVAALARQAETSEEARLAYEAFRPLGPEFEARIEARIVRALQPEAGVSAPAAQAPPSPAPPVPRPPVPAPAAARPLAPARTFPWHARRTGGWLAATATLAASLAILLVARRDWSPLPIYALEISGGTQTTRGLAPGSIPILRRGSEVALVLRPPTKVSGTSAARCCFLVRGETWRSWPLPVETSGQSFRFAGRLGGDVEPGAWTLWAVVGRPGSLPDEATLRARLRQAGRRHPGWQALSKDVAIE